MLTAPAQATDAQNPGSSSTDQSDSKARLVLTTGIVKRRSCGYGHLGLTLKLTFRNTGQEPIILDRRSTVGTFMVSRDLAAAATRKYEESIRYTDFPDLGEGEFGYDAPTNLSNFIILGVGEVFETEAHVSITTDHVPPPAARRGKEIHLEAGTHFLQVGVGTWYYVAESEPVRKKWGDKGYLWSEGLISEPMPFEVRRDLPIVECP
jgi:hypothetical protein